MTDAHDAARGVPGEGKGRRDEVGRGGIWPVSGPRPPGADVPIVGQEELAHGPRGFDSAEMPTGASQFETDPVCGSRVNTATAERGEHKGHAYYFDSVACRQALSMGGSGGRWSIIVPVRSMEPPVVLSQIMATPVTVERTTPINVALAVMRDRGTRHLFVTRDDEIIGLVSNRDWRRVLHRADAEGTVRGLHTIPVSDIMTAGETLVTARPDTPLIEGAQIMAKREIGCLPIRTEAGHFVGFVELQKILLHVLRALGS